MTDHRALDAAVAPAPAVPQIQVAPIPLKQVLPWLLLAALVALVTIYFVGADQGALSVINGNAVHEWTHDGRHLLGFPCH